MADATRGKILASKKEEAELMSASFGKKEGKHLLLHPLEAAYLSGMGLLDVRQNKKSLGQKEILKLLKIKKSKKIAKLPSPLEQLKIYSQLREGARVVRFNPHSPQYWLVYARGVGREQERAQTLLRLTCPGWKAALSSLERELSLARQLRMELVLAFIENNSPAFIKLNKFSTD